MKGMLKDAGTHSMFWSGIGAFWAMYTLQEWLAIISLVIGLIGGLVNLYAKCREERAMENDERRKEELHKAKLVRLNRGLRDGDSE